MKGLLKRLLVTGGLSLLLVGQMAHAQVVAPAAYSPFAFNGWAGVGFDYLSVSGGGGSSESKLGLAFGGDVGLRFTPTFAVVALGEYEPIVSGTAASHMVTVGGGIRVQNFSAAQFVLGGGYSSIDTTGGSTSGFGLKALGFYPWPMGFGPYLQLGYNRFTSGPATLDVFTANLGISYSY